MVNRSVRCCRQDAFARRERGKDFGAAVARRYGVGGRHCIGPFGERLAGVNPYGRVQQCRSVGTGIRGKAGRDRPTIAQRDRARRKRSCRDVLGEHARQRRVKLDLTRLDRFDDGFDAAKDLLNRRQPADALCFALCGHRSLPVVFCGADRIL